MPKVYLSCGMSNYPWYNEGLFYVAEQLAQRLGWETVNPARKDKEAGIVMDPLGTPLPPEEYEKIIKGDLEDIQTCDAIWMLPHWEDSIGACRELAFAETIGITVYRFGSEDLPPC